MTTVAVKQPDWPRIGCKSVASSRCLELQTASHSGVVIGVMRKGGKIRTTLAQPSAFSGLNLYASRPKAACTYRERSRVATRGFAKQTGVHAWIVQNGAFLYYVAQWVWICTMGLDSRLFSSTCSSFLPVASGINTCTSQLLVYEISKGIVNGKGYKIGSRTINFRDLKGHPPVPLFPGLEKIEGNLETLLYNVYIVPTTRNILPGSGR
ncbi:hypothetical protein C8R43DRAFT_954727 [Mycena crocata]|nr:hypothetical protein C8R43DRAFT_954727 [Mycena crocata]